MNDEQFNYIREIASQMAKRIAHEFIEQIEYTPCSDAEQAAIVQAFASQMEMAITFELVMKRIQMP